MMQVTESCWARSRLSVDVYTIQRIAKANQNPIVPAAIICGYLLRGFTKRRARAAAAQRSMDG